MVHTRDFYRRVSGFQQFLEISLGWLSSDFEEFLQTVDN